MKSRLFALLLATCTACSGGESPATRAGSASEATGSVTIPLLAVAGANTYRLSGTIDIYWSGAAAMSRYVGPLALSSSAAFVEHALPVGSYTFELRSDWRLWRRAENGAETDVTAVAMLTDPVTRFRVVTITANASTHATWSFSVAGQPVILDPCVPNPNVPQCSTGDADGDGVANGIECPVGAATASCVDSDLDGTADYLDTDSDNDLLVDSVDPGRLDACAPDPFSPACVNPTRGTARVSVEVAEVCDAGQCTFGGDAGSSSGPLAPSPLMFTAALPVQVAEGADVTLSFSIPLALPPGEQLRATLRATDSSECELLSEELLFQSTIVQRSLTLRGRTDGVDDGDQPSSLIVTSWRELNGVIVERYQDVAVPVVTVDVN